jgi:ASC-1-like (ASCH) protein
MKTHYLKTWPPYFERIKNGQKTFEVRKNDRDFQVGDTAILNEFNPKTQEFTGDEVIRIITYVLHGGQFGIESGFCVFGLSNVDNFQP